MESWKLQKKPMDGFIPFSANVVTYQERALLPSGTYTIAQNVRDYRPGLKKRPGLEDLTSYVYGGPTVDVRPSHDEGGGDGSGIINIHALYGYGDPASNILDSDPSTNLGRAETQSSNYMAPGVYGDGDWQTFVEYSRGRVAFQVNLLRYSYVSTITSASIFIRVLSAQAQTNIRPDGTITLAATRSYTEPATCNGFEAAPGTMLTNIDSDLYGTQTQVDPALITDPDGLIVEIPMTSRGISLLNASLTANGGDGRCSFAIVEYDIDLQEDDQPTWDGRHGVNMRIDRYWPFIRMTFSDAPPACISLFQYNQQRSGVTETLAYFENGDVLSAYAEPPTAASDTRLSGATGANGGYWPYSDGMPSSERGYNNLQDIAPTYDSKWGDFVWREGGYNTSTLDWDHCYYEADVDDFPPSWGVLDDVCIMADGRGLAKFYGGELGQPCKASLMVIDPAGDDTGTFRDDWDGTGISIAFPATATENSYFYIYSPILADEYLVSINTANTSDGAVRASIWTGAAWSGIVAADLIDETQAVTNRSFGQAGRLYSGSFLNNKPQRLNGLSGYWIRFHMTSTNATFNVNFKAKYSFQSLTNVWDGVLLNATEAKFFDASAGASGIYYTYANTSITTSLMTSSDKLYFSTFYKPLQIYVDVGTTPNTGSPVGTLSFQYWNGAQWNTWSVIDDQTNGLTRSGFIKLNRTNIEDKLIGSQKQDFQGSLYGLHWFRMSTSQTLGDDMRISITYEPILDITDLGDNTNCCCAWKERAVYSFDKYPSWIYITKNGTVNVLNGADYAVLQAGDGRRNAVKSMRKFHNELMVWQEEKGSEGGCLTLFEGYSPTTFGKLLLSSKIGTLNANCTVVVDGALEASRTDYAAATIAYFISNYGVFMSDGQTVVSISAAIQNYFDPESSDCIRNGYQDMCWLAHDPTHQVLRLGLVSGSSATQPNVFPVYDLITKKWSFDTYASTHTLRCMAETSGDSSVSAVQVAATAGTVEGKVFNASSTNLNDDGDTAIDMQVRIEFNNSGHLLELNELAVRLKKQSAGNCLFTVYENGVLNTEFSETIDMTQGNASEENVVERLMVGVKQEDSISVHFQNNVINQDLYLFDYWVDMDSLVNR